MNENNSENRMKSKERLQKDISIHKLREDDFFSMTTLEEADPQYFQQSHRHDFYEIIWFTEVESTAKQLLDFNEYTINNQEVYLLTPNQIHKMSPEKKKGYALAFAKEFFHSVIGKAHEFSYASSYYKAIVPLEKQLTFKQLFQMIEYEYNNKKRRTLLKYYYGALLIHLEELLAIENYKKPEPEATGKILYLIEQHFKEEKAIGFYSQQMTLSPWRLNSLLKKSTGKTLKQHLIQRTVLEAKRLLLAEDILIKELAYSLGYLDVPYFVNIFKQFTGLSPNQFRIVHMDQHN
ncbi:AraC family transcriptional regulator [Pedobacter antarcticus]|uniref:AraC family transcriptional regulator n=1 Tax=Pedobacter antarcticus TaxID=34086 RepID=UPI00292EC2F6|nr:AraC family transcriptional regulator [Pedobacter antarcticus]